MFDITVLDKFDELVKAITGVDDGHAKTTAARKVAEIASPVMQRLLEQAAPDGRKWDFPSSGERELTIAKSWLKPEIVERSGDRITGVDIIFANRANHIGIILAGSPAHSEPKYRPGPMKFFWHREGKYVKRYFVNHPGFPSNQFTVDAFEPDGRVAFENALRTEIPQVYTPLRAFFGN